MKTISLKKKVAAVAVASLGLGLLSVVPAQSAAGTTIAPTLTTLSRAGTAATPLIQGTAFTADLTWTLGTAAMADTEVCNVAYVITSPVGAEVKDATFTKAAANVGTNGVVTQSTAAAGFTSGQTITVTATGGNVAAAAYVVGTLSFTPTMGGTYTITSTSTGAGCGGTKTEMDGATSAARGALYTQGIAVTQGVTRGASGTARTGNQAQVRITYPEAEGTTYKQVSSGVGAIVGATPTDAVNTNISGVATDFSAGLTTVTTTNNTAHNNVLTLSSTAAGVQTITVTTVDTTTGLSSALYSITVTWSASPQLSASSSIVRISAPAAAGASQNTVTPGANFTTTADAIPYAAPRAVGNRVAKIEVILINNDGTAATQGHTVTASVTGSGFVTTDDAATAADGTARSESEALTAGSENVAWIKISGDGTAGTGTINISVTDAVSGVTTVLPSKTVTFYGAVTKLAVTKTNFTVGRAGFTIGGANTTRVAATEIGSSTNTSTVTGGTTTTPAFIVTASDSGNRNVTTASVPTVISSDANVATGGTCVLDAGQDATYSSGLPSAGGTNTVGVYNCNWTAAANAASGSKATLTVRVADPASTTGGFLTTTVAVTIGGSISTETLSFDKASYAPGEGMVITRTAKDSAGNPVFDGATAGAITFNRPVGGTAPAAGVYIGGTSASSTSVAKASVFAPSISGAFTASMTGGDAAETVRTANATVANPVDAQITALVAAIAKLQAAIDKIQKRLARR